MKLVALNLPESANEWPSWLEQQLVGLQLRNLVEQLEVIGGGDRTNQPNLTALLGEQRIKILSDGLGVLLEPQLQALIAHPRCLLELQDIVLQSGGAYWQRLERTAAHQQQVSNQWQRIRAAIETQSVGSPTPSSPRTQTDHDTPRWTRWVVVASALAASLMIIVFAVQNGSMDQGKFFARKGLLQSPKLGGEFLREVASVIQADWQPDINEPKLLQSNLARLVAACDLFNNSDLPQLKPAVRQEAKKRCQGWRDKFSGNLADLAVGRPFVDVRTEANATVERLIKVLQELDAS